MSHFDTFDLGHVFERAMILRPPRLLIMLMVPIFFGGFISPAVSAKLSVGIVITSTEQSTTSTARYTCNAAKTKISLEGYQDIETLSCEGDTYLFLASQDNQTLNIGFNSATGEISIV